MLITNKKYIFSLLTLVVGGVSCSTEEPAILTNSDSENDDPRDPDSRPNVVMILIDDTGWNAQSLRMDSSDPGSCSTYHVTPNMDALAKSGMRFSYAYSPAPTSGPSRNSIQFGRTPSSLGIFAECPADYMTQENAPNADAMCNVIKANYPEYKTAHLGKWHILRTPDELGYDLHDGETTNSEGQSSDPEDPKCTFSLSSRAVDFMEEQVEAGNPFYLQVSYYANHETYQALPETEELFENTTYAANKTEYHFNSLWAAMNLDLDTGIGEVLKGIEDLGISDNTYIILTGDNGYQPDDGYKDSGSRVMERGYYKAYPLRSHKYLISEGGLRVPFYISGPGIASEQESSVSVVGNDIYPTVLDILNIADKTPSKVEGGSILPLAWGKSSKVERKDPFMVFRYTKTKSSALDISIVEGDYKFMKELQRTGGNDKHLFNLRTDPGESVDLYYDNREFADDLYLKMTEYFESTGWDESQAGSIFD